MVRARSLYLRGSWFESMHSHHTHMPDIGIDQKDVYFVAVKIFLEKDGMLLILRDNFGDWDLAGGRIKKERV